MRLDPAYFGAAVGSRPPRAPLVLNHGSPQAKGLAAAWPLFAGKGYGWQDLSGHGAGLVPGTGTEEPTEIVRAGLDAKVPDFNSDEMHVGAGDVPALDITGDQITLAAWIYPNTLGDINGSRIISKRTDAGGTDVYALFSITADPNFFYFRCAGTDLIVTTRVLVDEWQHWCGTYDGATMRLYRNGVEVGSTSKTGNITNSARAVYLGHRENEARYFNGAMAEARIYGHGLSGAEVWALYDPATRWSLYREAAVPRVWPAKAAGGVTVESDHRGDISWRAEAAAAVRVLQAFEAERQANAAVAVESLSEVRAAMRAATDWLAALTAPAALAVAWRGTVAVATDHKAPLAWDAAAASAAPMPAGWGRQAGAENKMAMAAGLGMAAEARPFMEVLRGSGGAARLGLEWGGAVLVQSDNPIPLTWRAELAAGGTAALSWRGAIVTTAKMPAEISIGAQADGPAALAWLRSLGADIPLLTAWGTVAVVNSDHVMPLAFGGQTVFLAGNVNVFTVDAEGAVWRVPARGVVFQIEKGS